MNEEQYRILSADLKRAATRIPLHWGRIQNNGYDNELKRHCNIFDIMSLDELEKNISDFDAGHQAYYRRRWFLLRCAGCDEYLFCKNPNVIHNPDTFDKKWDITINGHIRLDIKGTVIPKAFRNEYRKVIDNPEEIIRFYYENQSQGIRYDMQDRLFIVHHSAADEGRELLLRCAWEKKELIYNRFIENAETVDYFRYKDYKVAVIFIVETNENVLSYKIAGLDSGLEAV